jgi:MOSC domain-containing protein YiiM
MCRDNGIRGGSVSETYLSTDEIEAGLEDVLASPRDGGQLAAIVARPGTDLRELRPQAYLSPEGGMEGDRWLPAGESSEQQVSLMNVRLLRYLAGGDQERMALAGDNLVVDLDLGAENMPAGQRLRIGDVVLEMTDAPHTGCAKFVARFGRDATRFINAAERRSLHLRGRYARIVEAGTVRVGDTVRKVPLG